MSRSTVIAVAPVSAFLDQTVSIPSQALPGYEVASSSAEGGVSPAASSGRGLLDALAELGPIRPVTQPEAITGEIAEASTSSRALPPPVRPQVSSAMEQHAAVPEFPVHAALGEQEIVRALVDAALPVPAQAQLSNVTRAPPIAFEALDRPPMIIERAHAERDQRARGTLAMPVHRNPLPGLGIGFGLAILMGGAMYLLLATGY